MKLTKYQSDFTRFLQDLKATHPSLEQEQREGRNRLWDKAPIDLEDRQCEEVSRVKQQAYYYQTR